MNRLVMVISWDEPIRINPNEFGEMLDRFRELVQDKPGVEVHAAMREAADAILEVTKKD